MKRKASGSVKRPTAKKALPVRRPKSVSWYNVQVGGRSDPGETESFDTEGKARSRGRTAFEAMIPWCRSYNTAGEKALNDAIGELNVSSFTGTHKQVSAMFDEHTNMCIVVTFWHGLP